jgi:hypothetical protein
MHGRRLIVIVQCMPEIHAVVSNRLVFFLLDTAYFLFLSPQLPPTHVNCTAFFTAPIQIGHSLS